MNTTAYCRKVAANATKGLVFYYTSHMTYNYQFYEDQFLTAVNSSNKNKVATCGHIVAVRSEHLDEDFKNLEMFLWNGKVAVPTNSVTTPE